MSQNYIEEYEETEIDLLSLFRKLWARKWTIAIITGVFMVLGVFAALAMERAYKSKVIFVPQASKSISGNLSSLASLAGVDLSSTTKDGPISPIVYPYILENTNLQKELVHTPIHFQGYAQPIELVDYFTDPQYARKNFFKSLMGYTIGLPGRLKSAFQNRKAPEPIDSTAVRSGSGPKIPVLTAEEAKAAKALSSFIEMEVDKKEGQISITCIMPERLASAELTCAVYGLLKKYISDFKVEKARSNLEYLEEQYATAKADYQAKQHAYAVFKDQNRGVKTALAETEIQRMYSEAELSRLIYTELAKNCLSARVKVTEDNVSFTELSPASIPERPSNSRTLKVIIWTLLGGVVGCAYVLISSFFKKEEEEEKVEE